MAGPSRAVGCYMKKKIRAARQEKYCGSGEKETTAAGQMLEWPASEASKYSYVKERNDGFDCHNPSLLFSLLSCTSITGKFILARTLSEEVFRLHGACIFPNSGPPWCACSVRRKARVLDLRQSKRVCVP